MQAKGHCQIWQRKIEDAQQGLSFRQAMKSMKCVSHVCSGMYLRESIDGISDTKVSLVTFYFIRQLKAKERQISKKTAPTDASLESLAL